MALRTLVHRASLSFAVVVITAVLLAPPPEVGSLEVRADDDVAVAPSLRGKLLVATATMPDPTFIGTRLYVLEHDALGALAVVVNRPLAAPRAPLPLHDGGPVGKDVVVLIHSDEYRRTETTLIAPGVAVTPTGDALDDILDNVGPQRWLLAWGYAGWAPLQLEGELAEGVWRVEDADGSVLPAR